MGSGPAVNAADSFYDAHVLHRADPILSLDDVDH
jgi:hypothetical protein